MSRSAIALAALLAMLAAPAARADNARPGPGGMLVWPASGQYVTMKMQLPNGAPACIAGLKAGPQPSAGGAKAGYTIWLQAGSTHLWVTYEGASAPTADTVAVLDRGQVLATLPVLKRLPAAGSFGYMADMSDGLWDRVVAPRIAGGGVELGLGDLRIPLPAEEYATAAGYRDECLARLRSAQP